MFVVVRSELNSANKFHGFLNSTANDLSANWKFEPIFLRKSRFCSEFPSANKIVPILASKMNRLADGDDPVLGFVAVVDMEQRRAAFVNRQKLMLNCHAHFPKYKTAVERGATLSGAASFNILPETNSFASEISAGVSNTNCLSVVRFMPIK